jgi:hypothetical protein
VTARLLAVLMGGLTVPSTAWASGGEVLSLLWLECALFALVVSSLFVLRLTVMRKLLVFGAYFLAAAGVLYATRDWPYSANLMTINAISIGLPFLSWLLAVLYFCFRRRQT